MPRLVAVTLLVIGIGGVGGLVAARRHGDRPPAARPALRPSPAPPADAPPARDGAGTCVGVLFASEQVVVASRSPGRIRAVHVRLGDRVTRGQSLATLEADSLEQELAGARAALRAAAADAEKANVEVAQATDRLVRAEKLAGVNPQIEIADARFQRETALAHLALARASVAGARAKVEQTAGTVNDSNIRAPFDGAVAERDVDAGALVAVGTPIVRIITADDLRVRFAVPETEAGAVRAGGPIAVEVLASGLVLAGAVDRMAPEIDPASRTLVVEGKLVLPPGEAARLASGLEARVRLLGASGGSAAGAGHGTPRR